MFYPESIGSLKIWRSKHVVQKISDLRVTLKKQDQNREKHQWSEIGHEMAQVSMKRSSRGVSRGVKPLTNISNGRMPTMARIPVPSPGGPGPSESRPNRAANLGTRHSSCLEFQEQRCDFGCSSSVVSSVAVLQGFFSESGGQESH